MVNKLTVLDWVALVLVVVGGLNWGLVGALKYDLVASLFGGVEGVVARVVYVLVGLAALYLVFVVSKLARK